MTTPYTQTEDFKDLPVRISNTLKRNRYYSAAQLTAASDEDLLNHYGLGPLSLHIIRAHFPHTPTTFTPCPHCHGTGQQGSNDTDRYSQ